MFRKCQLLLRSSLVSSLVFISFSSLPAQDDSSTVTMVRPGVVYQSIIDGRGPWRINILEIDLTQPDLEIESARAFDKLLGREKTSSIAARRSGTEYEVIGAINADFFSLRTGENENNQTINGEFVKGTKRTGSTFDTFDNIHSQFGVTFDRKPVLDRFAFIGSVIWRTGATTELQGVNDLPTSNAAFLFNAYYGDRTPTDTLKMEINELALQQIARRADTLYAVVGQWNKVGGSTIAQGSLVLSFYNMPVPEHASQSKKGDTVKIWLGFKPKTGRIKSLIGGWPRIVLDGKNIGALADSIEGTFPRFSANRHPRSGVGFSKDSTKVYFITVDGRQQSSVGMSLTEFADWMIRAGAYQGLNLDGGGSTTLVLNGTIVNSPSDQTGERPIANCLLLLARKK